MTFQANDIARDVCDLFLYGESTRSLDIEDLLPYSAGGNQSSSERGLIGRHKNIGPNRNANDADVWAFDERKRWRVAREVFPGADNFKHGRRRRANADKNMRQCEKVLRLYFGMNLPAEHVGEEMEMSARTVEKMVSRARILARKLFKQG